MSLIAWHFWPTSCRLEQRMDRPFHEGPGSMAEEFSATLLDLGRTVRVTLEENRMVESPSRSARMAAFAYG